MLGMSWQPEIDAGTRSAADVTAMFARLPGWDSCWMSSTHRLERVHRAAGVESRFPAWVSCSSIATNSILQCLYVGAGAQDPGFARKLGFTYRHESDFFGSAASWA